MKFFLLLLLLLSGLKPEAQEKPPSRAELEKMMNSPEVKKAMQQAGVSLDDLDTHQTEASWGKIPVRNTSALAIVSNTVLTSESLPPFLSDIRSKIFKSLSAAHTSKISQVKDSVRNHPNALIKSAVMAWYSNSPYVALGLAAEASVLSADTEVLNNLAALLSFNGLQQKSIPLLLFINKQIPGNATVLNNIGQAYLGLGETVKGEQYLLQCTSALAVHPEANKSLALLFRSQGQLAKARQCIGKSLQGAYSETAVELAEQLGMEREQIDGFIIQPYKNLKVPEYFNNYKYTIPPLSETVQDAAKTDNEHHLFRAYLDAEKEKYERLLNEQQVLMEEGAHKMVADAMASIQSGGVVRNLPSPMFEKAKRVFNYWMLEFQEFGTEVLMPAYLKMKEREKELDDKYDEEYVKINTGTSTEKCGEFDALANRYLPLYAANQRNFMEKFLVPYRGYMDEFMYWSQFFSVLEYGRTLVIGFNKEHMNQLEALSRMTKIIYPSCQPVPEFNITGEADSTPEKKCPFNIKINLVIGSMSMDCEKFSLSADAGISFSAEKNFKTKETTLAIGIGIGNTKNLPIPGLDWSGNIGISEQMFVVFDGNNNFQDVGFKMEAAAGVSVDISGSAGSTNLGSSSISSGYKFSLNDGFKFETEGKGIFKDAFN